MSDAAGATIPARPSSAMVFLKRAMGFWKGPQRATAWLWTASALVLVLANLAVTVGINRWNKWFSTQPEKPMFLLVISPSASACVSPR